MVIHLAGNSWTIIDYQDIPSDVAFNLFDIVS